MVAPQSTGHIRKSTTVRRMGFARRTGGVRLAYQTRWATVSGRGSMSNDKIGAGIARSWRSSSETLSVTFRCSISPAFIFILTQLYPLEDLCCKNVYFIGAPTAIMYTFSRLRSQKRILFCFGDEKRG